MEDNKPSLWITTEKLPESGTDILMLIDNENHMGQYNGQYKKFIVFTSYPPGEYCSVDRVSHWMPYPELPKI